jgi:hypothetical protein
MNTEKTIIEIVKEVMVNTVDQNWADVLDCRLEAEGYEVIPVLDPTDTDVIASVMIDGTPNDIVYSQYEDSYRLVER